jgi:hypothetical protein
MVYIAMYNTVYRTADRKVYQGNDKVCIDTGVMVKKEGNSLWVRCPAGSAGVKAAWK